MAYIYDKEELTRSIQADAASGVHLFFSNRYKGFTTNKADRDCETVARKIGRNPESYCGFYHGDINAEHLLDDIEFIKPGA